MNVFFLQKKNIYIHSYNKNDGKILIKFLYFIKKKKMNISLATQQRDENKNFASS